MIRIVEPEMEKGQKKNKLGLLGGLEVLSTGNYFKGLLGCIGSRCLGFGGIVGANPI